MPIPSKLKAVFCILLILSGVEITHARPNDKQAVLAVLTLNLGRFTSWPKKVFDNKAPTLNLCVIGDNIVQESFKRMNNTVVNGKVLHVLNRSRLRNLSQCQLLYINGLERSVLVHILLDLKNKPVLTVGEERMFIQLGGMVGIEKKSGKMQLNINLPIVKQSQLVISPRILKLANIFDFPYLEK